MTKTPIDSPELYDIIDELLRPDTEGDFKSRLNDAIDGGYQGSDLVDLLEVAIFIISQQQ